MFYISHGKSTWTSKSLTQPTGIKKAWKIKSAPFLIHMVSLKFVKSINEIDSDFESY